eukprot:363973-Chlamydomonas_euryale.AAC.18
MAAGTGPHQGSGDGCCDRTPPALRRWLLAQAMAAVTGPHQRSGDSCCDRTPPGLRRWLL